MRQKGSGGRGLGKSVSDRLRRSSSCCTMRLHTPGDLQCGSRQAAVRQDKGPGVCLAAPHPSQRPQAQPHCPHAPVAPVTSTTSPCAPAGPASRVIMGLPAAPAWPTAPLPPPCSRLVSAFSRLGGSLKKVTVLTKRPKSQGSRAPAQQRRVYVVSACRRAGGGGVRGGGWGGGGACTCECHAMLEL